MILIPLMIISSILAIIIGVLVGIVIGVVPGLHANTLSAIILAGGDNLEISIFLFSMLVSSNIFDFLAACYLGVPEEGEILVRMPLHKLLLNKRSLAGMRIVAMTSVMTYAIFLGVGFLLKDAIIALYDMIKGYAWLILAAICMHLIIKEKNSRLALIFFTISGLLGLITFNINLKDPFLPMLTGLFGIGSLLISGRKSEKIPTQMKKVVIDSDFFDLAKASIIGILSSIVMALVPSMSPSQVGLLSEDVEGGKRSDERMIASMSSINIADLVLSLISLLTLGKGRSGVVEKIGTLLIIDSNNYFVLLFSGFLSCVLSSYLLVKSALWVSQRTDWFNNRLLNIGVILFVSILTVAIDGPVGIIILAVSTIIGYLCDKNKIRKSQLLGCLVIPTIMFYLNFM
ncbi:Tripartite tricarboxylate transporter TctA family protein [Candidatus Tiddalikarchaeum anstoanum]|nr:Tripartite tricarboxylate transporter TctA family protein [Candidatus Tiddalikarchaeum anstoanum]